MAGFLDNLRSKREREKKLEREMTHIQSKQFVNPIGDALSQYGFEVKQRVMNPAVTLRSAIDRMKSQPAEEMAMDWSNPVAGAMGGIIKGGKIAEALNLRHPNVDAFISEGDNLLTLNKVVVPENLRGQGYGSNFLADLVDAADAERKTLALTPSADFGGNKNKLTKWYKDYGFMPNKGKTSDYSISESMYRTPLEEYKGLHTAPTKDYGAPLHDLTGGGTVYPDDVYSGMAHRYYGTGDDAKDMRLFQKIRQYKDKPDEMVDVFRAVPKNVEGNRIRQGDWVTIDRQYAVDHGESALGGDYKIQRIKAPAKSLFTNGDSPYEFGLDRTQIVYK